MHTSADTIGQVYLPWVNRILLVLVMLLVLVFQTSSNLASAYGVSVTGSMLIDTILLIILAAQKWRLLGAGRSGRSRCCSWSIDIALFSANAIKFLEGAWFPVALGMLVVHRDAHLAPRPRPGPRAGQSRQPAHRALRRPA